MGCQGTYSGDRAASSLRPPADMGAALLFCQAQNVCRGSAAVGEGSSSAHHEGGEAAVMGRSRQGGETMTMGERATTWRGERR